MKFYLLSMGLVFCLPLMAADKKPLTKAQIDQLQKALPKCQIISNPKE
tara:strand:- start:344 stop:487 length:144 start_codon:yes stop_codon:yes gene_type:complete